MLKVSDNAVEVLERAHHAATRFNPDAKVRVYRRGDAIETAFADSPEINDAVLELEGLTVFVEEGISGTLDVSTEHDRLIVRP